MPPQPLGMSPEMEEEEEEEDEEYGVDEGVFNVFTQYATANTVHHRL